MKTFLCILIFLFPLALFAQDGNFSNEMYVVEDADGDTVMVDSLSGDIPGYAAMTIYYRFTDTVIAGTTLYFEAQVQPIKNQITGYAIVDSIVVSSFSAPSGSDFLVWNITDGAVGIEERYRLRKSGTADSLVAVYRGYEEIR